MKYYANRDVSDLGNHYTRHLEAMTVEGLVDKSAIAAELAWRDARITELCREIGSINRLRARLVDVRKEIDDILDVGWFQE